MMKAVICTAYGGPEVLQIQDVPKPVPGDKDLLVRVHATSVNSGDVRVRGLVVDGFMRIVMRIVLGFRGPRKPILGTALSGTVEAMGAGVTTFKPGDRVMAVTGFDFGANAEYATVPEKGAVCLMPANASFEEAAAILFGGMSALYFLQKAGIGEIANQQVMIYGATGSVGAAAVEIAKQYGAHVTSVCGEQGMALAKQLGSDKVLDYTKTDLARVPDRFDIIFEAVEKKMKKACMPLLKPGGKFVTVGGMDVAKDSKAMLEQLRHFYEQGKLHASIDRVYDLADIAEAHRYVDTGRKKGNVVVRVNT